MSEYIAKYDVCLSCEPMPMNIRSLIKRVGDCNCIVINDYLSDEAKKKAFKHEIDHLLKNDLDSNKSVKEIEEDNEF
jgi:DNA integrity scanning protein DisA with diadenylate cyclase activity